MTHGHVLLVDLNNFGHYPTLSIGYAAAILRRDGINVSVVSPLAHGIPGIQRERQATWLSRVAERLRQESALSPNRAVRATRELLRARAEHRFLDRVGSILRVVERALIPAPDAVLVSTYTMYAPVCEQLGRLCAMSRVPLLIGGAYFTQPDTIAEWTRMEGVSAVMSGEPEPFLADLVGDLIARNPLEDYPGVSTPRHIAPPAPPLRDLDAVPYPDFSDFPWARYPTPIVPIISGRGCGWGACTFCSDITSGNGRTYRSRSPANVLAEIDHQRARHRTSHFVFTDLKLNSNLEVWNALTTSPKPDNNWVASVHVDSQADCGLSKDQLKAARAAGAVRLTTGLESGSQRIADAMRKGTDLERTSQFLHDAADADISVRTTMILGYPGETAEDLHLTASYLRQHQHCIERVSLNRLAIIPATRLAATLKRENGYSPITELTIDHKTASTRHYNSAAKERAYRRAIGQVVNAAHQINRKPLRPAARAFEGVM